jgi:hypothetical protein
MHTIDVVCNILEVCPGVAVPPRPGFAVFSSLPKRTKVSKVGRPMLASQPPALATINHTPRHERHQWRLVDEGAEECGVATNYTNILRRTICAAIVTLVAWHKASILILRFLYA